MSRDIGMCDWCANAAYYRADEWKLCNLCYREWLQIREAGDERTGPPVIDPDLCLYCGHEMRGGYLRPDAAKDCPCWCHPEEAR